MAGPVRDATPDDAAAIAALQLRAWRWNYQDIADAHELFETGEDERTAVWAGLLGPGAESGTRTLVADLAGSVRAFATVGPSREAEHPTGELRALYVDPPAQGAGLGTTLLAAAELALHDAGHREAVLRTLAENGLARGLFERCGWLLVPGGDGEHRWGPTVLYRRTL